MIALETPAAFDPPEFVKYGGETVLYYYSFVTLTTLGFGDITPVSSLARILSTIESLMGLVILGVLVGRVVGLLVSQQASSDTDRKLEAIEDKIGRLSSQLSTSTEGQEE
jgi:mannose/fructose/N-acetylgalactosamine-specific phosphotransferase system component IID